MYNKIINLYYEGYSEGEIAAKLGIPLYEVRDVLDDYFEDDW